MHRQDELAALEERRDAGRLLDPELLPVAPGLVPEPHAVGQAYQVVLQRFRRRDRERFELLLVGLVGLAVGDHRVAPFALVLVDDAREVAGEGVLGVGAVGLSLRLLAQQHVDLKRLDARGVDLPLLQVVERDIGVHHHLLEVGADEALGRIVDGDRERLLAHAHRAQLLHQGLGLLQRPRALRVVAGHAQQHPFVHQIEDLVGARCRALLVLGEGDFGLLQSEAALGRLDGVAEGRAGGECGQARGRARHRKSRRNAARRHDFRRGPRPRTAACCA